MTGRIDLLFTPTITSLSLIEGGKLKALAQSGETRNAVLPEVPTMKEAGFPAVGVESWTAILAPSTVPPNVLGVLRASFDKAVSQDNVKASFEAQNQTLVAMDPVDWPDFISNDLQAWKNIIDVAGIDAN